MTQDERRRETLDLLARGKITLDEAVLLLEYPAESDTSSQKRDSQEKTVKMDESAGDGVDIVVEEMSAVKEQPAAVSPRWLRISVDELNSGRNKVRVNIPFGMVKFGLGMARLFAPQEYSGSLEGMGELIGGADLGMLVDVEDAESNEHVRIYVD